MGGGKRNGGDVLTLEVLDSCICRLMRGYLLPLSRIGWR